jgi:hypothetical protein
MSLVSDILTEAFLDLGAIAPGETNTTAELADAFMRLNQMIASWSTEQLTVPSMVHAAYQPTAGVTIYTLGPAGTFTTAATAIRVTGASSVQGNFRSPMKVMSWDQFAAEVADPKASSSVLAEVLAADGSFPSINLKIFPTPAAGPGTLWLDYWSAITQFVTQADTINLASGWEVALHSNLAVALYPQYARAGGIPPELAALAQSSKGALNALNMRILGQQQQTPPQAGQ